eukprot:143044-Prymnesium_polylepis.1
MNLVHAVPRPFTFRVKRHRDTRGYGFTVVRYHDVALHYPRSRAYATMRDVRVLGCGCCGKP